MDEALLEILACPKSKRPLRRANKAELDAVNADIKKKKCKANDGELVSEKVEDGLVESEANTLYVIKKGIPVLIFENAIQI